MGNKTQKSSGKPKSLQGDCDFDGGLSRHSSPLHASAWDNSEHTDQIAHGRYICHSTYTSTSYFPNFDLRNSSTFGFHRRYDSTESLALPMAWKLTCSLNFSGRGAGKTTRNMFGQVFDRTQIPLRWAAGHVHRWNLLEALATFEHHKRVFAILLRWNSQGSSISQPVVESSDHSPSTPRG